MLLSKIDEFGKFGWAMVIVLGFWLAWPIGLMTLAFLAGSGRLQMAGRGRCGPGAWFNMDNARATAGGTPLNGVWGKSRTNSSGNKAFDDYREETLRRLEEEEREFQSFLERLRKARDKSEFDAFMAERRDRTTGRDVGESV
jgi:hypothetical protein